MTQFNGSVSSFLSLGGADGPSIRSVVFMQGCPIRCIYCHNPETWEFKENNINSDDLVAKILRYKPYYAQNGGVTLSGGEPLCQPKFIYDLFTKLKKHDIHTCIDTSAQVNLIDIVDVLKITDLVLCDIKFLSDVEYKKYTNGDFNKVSDFLDLCLELNIPIWIRHVIIPNITDNNEYILKLKSFCLKYTNIEKIELLPYKNICQSKYDNLGIEFKMKHLSSISNETLKNLQNLL